MSENGLVSSIKELFKHVSQKRKLQFLGVLLLTVVGSVFEVVSLGAVIPFISVLSSPESLLENESYSAILKIFNILSTDDLVITVTLFFGISALLAGFVRLLLIWTTLQVTSLTGADLSIKAFERILYKPYLFHVEKGSHEIINGIVRKVKIATSVLFSVVTIFTSLILFISIFGTLVYISPFVAFVSGLIFGILYVLISLFSKKILYNNSIDVAKESDNEVKSLQEGIGAIRDVLLDHAQKIHIKLYSHSITTLQKKQAENTFINQYPRYLMEMIGLVLISVLAYYSHTHLGEGEGYFPILGALALGAQRLLPLLQGIYSNWASALSNSASLIDVAEILEGSDSISDVNNEADNLEFNERIDFHNIFFKYKDKLPYVFENISMTIGKGQQVGVVGSTGCGKSTFLDVLMMLIKPTKGDITIDGLSLNKSLTQSWQKMIAHVPQDIFLLDASFIENIAFNVPKNKIDLDKVISAAKQAQIHTYIDSTVNGYDTLTGERGGKLSGGQKQRIGIARALYKNSPILILDEATSSLDTTTEKLIMNSIYSLNPDITVIMITHRIATLENCNFIVKFSGGHIEEIGTYSEMKEALGVR